MNNRNRNSKATALADLERQFNYATMIIAILADVAGGEIRIPPAVQKAQRDGSLKTWVDAETGDIVVSYVSHNVQKTDEKSENPPTEQAPGDTPIEDRLSKNGHNGEINATEE